MNITVQEKKALEASIAMLTNLLHQGKFSTVLASSEQILNSYPHSEGVLVCNLAARSSLEGIVDKSERMEFLKQSIKFVDAALIWAKEKRHLMYYYKGLWHLVIGEKDTAKQSFKAAIHHNPNFDIAEKMLKGMESD